MKTFLFLNILATVTLRSAFAASTPTPDLVGVCDFPNAALCCSFSFFDTTKIQFCNFIAPEANCPTAGNGTKFCCTPQAAIQTSENNNMTNLSGNMQLVYNGGDCAVFDPVLPLR